MEELVKRSRVENVGVLQMHRPERRNAMNTGLLQALLDAMRESASDEGCDAVVITGSGDSFSAGADVTEPVDEVGALHRMRLFAAVYEVVSHFPKPLVAAVDGACIGGGAEVAAGSDLRVGTERSRIRFPGAQFGIPIGTARLQLLLGTSHAKDLLMTARTFDGSEAYRLGFFNRLEEPADLLSSSVELVKEVAANPGALQQKRLLAEGNDLFLRVAQENRALIRWQSSAPGTSSMSNPE